MRCLTTWVLVLSGGGFVLGGLPGLGQEPDLGGKRGVLVKALKDPDRNTRRKAAEILAELGPAGKAAVLPLIEALGDKDRVVRATAARALANIGPDAVVAIPSLKEALKES